VLNIFLGNGDGTFQSGPSITTGAQPTSVRSADFNNDGKPDLVVTIGGRPIAPVNLQNYVTVLLNSTLSLSTTSLTFSSQKLGTTSAALTVVLTNIGAVPVGLSGFSLTGADPGDFKETTTCTASLAAGASCTVSVTFSPALTGSRSATLSISDTAPASPQTVTLRGTGH